MKKLLSLAVLAMVLFSAGSGVSVPLEGTSGALLTIYNSDAALVEEQRTFNLAQPEDTVELQGITRGAMPDSINFKPDNLSVAVLQQEFVYQPVNRERLLASSVGHEIEVVIPRPFGAKTFRGTLLSTEDGLVLQESSGKVQILPSDAEITLPKAPELATKPTLRWLVHSDVTGEVRGELSYLTGGLNWNASYNAVLDESETKMDLSSWVSIMNSTGVTFQNTRLNLIAGQLQRQPPQPVSLAPQAEKVAAAPQASAQFEAPTAAFEYHQYALKRPATLKDNQQSQLGFYSASAVPVDKRYVLDSNRGEKVWVMFDVVNSEQNNLGLALPAGLVRVYKRAMNGIQLVGEDKIDHWAKDEKVTLTVGAAFDLKAERKLTDHQLVSRDARGREVYRDTIEITLRNRKDQASQLEVIEHLSGYWKMLEHSLEFEKLDANRVRFHVLVPKGSEAKLTYTVEYTY